MKCNVKVLPERIAIRRMEKTVADNGKESIVCCEENVEAAMSACKPNDVTARYNRLGLKK